MDAATTALITAAAAEFGKNMLGESAKDAYTKVKSWITGRLAALGHALAGLEADPGCPDSKSLVQKKAAQADVDSEPEFVALRDALRSAMDSDPAGKAAVQVAIGSISGGQVAIGEKAVAAEHIDVLIQGNVVRS